MRVSYNWLKEYVKLDLSPQELANKLTMAGIEVDSVEYLGEGIDNVVTGQITDVVDHPNADKLVICQVDIGTEVIQIVTGAPNVVNGGKVAVALIGCHLPNGVKIKKAKLRGEVSQGMMCSAHELGLDPKNFSEEQQTGIIIFQDEGAVIGDDVKKTLGLDNYVLELGLTPNRADCMSMVNVAREVAALTGAEFRLPSMAVKETEGQSVSRLADVQIIEEDLCHRYVARVIKNISIGPSPVWMQQHLKASGVRPINNVVDVTNFIMMELGQPLHAFDYDKLSDNRIVVRKSVQGEKITTLDEEKRELDEDTLVIADAEKAVAIAGVMGGLDSEVTEGTKNILLESAYFQGESIRRTAKKVGLRSESSARFEKGIDKEQVAAAADRAAQLIAELGGGQVAPDSIDVYPKPWEQPVITMRSERVNKLLGTNISCDDMKAILKRLWMEVEEVETEVLKVKVPSYRNDLTSEIDLVEEVARLYGYGNINTTMPKGEPSAEPITAEEMLKTKVTKVLISCGLNEMISYSFISPKVMDKLLVSEGHPWRNYVEIQNPLTEEQGVMRTSLLPGLLETTAKNFKRRQLNLQFFEIGRVFLPSEGRLPDERVKIGAIVSGEQFNGWVQKATPLDFFHLKGIVESLLQQLDVEKVEFKAAAVPEEYPSLHPGRTAEVILNGECIGYIGEVHPQALSNVGLQQRATVMELDGGLLLKHVNLVPSYASLPKFPVVSRDLAIVVEDNVSADAIDKLIRDVGGELLKGITLFDVYKGTQISEGYRSLAYSMTYQALDRTLTDDEVSQLHDKIQQSLLEKFRAKIR